MIRARLPLLASALLSIATPLLAQHAEPVCTTVSDSNLPKDFASWADAAQSVHAGAGAATPSIPLLPLGRPVDFKLSPAGEVRLAVTPEQKRVPENAHAGLARLSIPTAGTWRVAASGPVWIDMLGPSGPVASANHGRMAPCTSLRKVVEFPLSAGEYVLQLSGNPGPELRLMVSPKP